MAGEDWGWGGDLRAERNVRVIVQFSHSVV